MLQYRYLARAKAKNFNNKYVKWGVYVIDIAKQNDFKISLNGHKKRGHPIK